MQLPESSGRGLQRSPEGLGVWQRTDNRERQAPSRLVASLPGSPSVNVPDAGTIQLPGKGSVGKTGREVELTCRRN